MRGCLWKSDKWLPSYAHKNILGPFAPSLKTKFQSPSQTKLKKKKLQSVNHKILKNWGVVCENLTSGFQNMPKKTILRPFAPSLKTKFHSPCQTKFSTTKNCEVLIIKFWKNEGLFAKIWLVVPKLCPKKPFWVHLPQVYKLGPSTYMRPSFAKK